MKYQYTAFLKGESYIYGGILKMAGYMIGNITITDPEVFAEYGRLVPGTVAAFGGSYVVRGGVPEAVEGDYRPVRIVVLRFDSVARAKEWYYSAEYAPLKEMRMRASTGDLYFVEGVPGG